MTPRKIQFSFEKRDIGLPYVLWVKIDEAGRWAAVEWDKKPSNKQIEEAKINFMRACVIYHKHIDFPDFQMEIIK